ncbi:hypothetical protein Tco_1225297, partial [Tanacetum coccineum]
MILVHLVRILFVSPLHMGACLIETELDGQAGFVNVARSGVESFGLSHDESFGFDDLDLNLNEHVDVNGSQNETQSELPVSEEPDIVRTQEPI